MNNNENNVNNNLMNNNIEYTQHKNYNYASLGNRLSALLKDWLHIWWYGILAYFIIAVIKILLLSFGVDSESLLNQFLTMLQISGVVLFIVYGQPLYCFFAECTEKHVSKGKRKNNMIILNKNNQPLTVGESFLRMILKYLTLFIPFGVIISIIMIGVTEKHQALHDIILDEIVVKNI